MNIPAAPNSAISHLVPETAKPRVTATTTSPSTTAWTESYHSPRSHLWTIEWTPDAVAPEAAGKDHGLNISLSLPLFIPALLRCHRDHAAVQRSADGLLYELAAPCITAGPPFRSRPPPVHAPSKRWDGWRGRLQTAIYLSPCRDLRRRKKTSKVQYTSPRRLGGPSEDKPAFRGINQVRQRQNCWALDGHAGSVGAAAPGSDAGIAQDSRGACYAFSFI
ncbi:unnamed protein product [Pleuronectes platessa]|uniref:Uncharacterized protein n=1 Tax=Pleuronectes platessa TaxID=8262 RepID=A0A9N7TQ18_PLEPL|nr:unnamed protein product [Pleuronectes platessa]